MADISGAVIGSLDLRQGQVLDKQKRVKASITFGDGALTYPAGGISVDKSLFGFRMELRELLFVDPSSADGYLYKFDQANSKIRIYQGDNNNAADAPLIELISGVATPAATTLFVEAIGR